MIKLAYTEARQKLGELVAPRARARRARRRRRGTSSWRSGCGRSRSRSRPGPRRSSATSSASGCSACRRSRGRSRDELRPHRRPGRAARRHPQPASRAVPDERVCATASTASMYEELAGAGVFSLRADGFAWADAAVVYEELGRGVIPGPLVATFGRDVDHRRLRRDRARRAVRRARRRRDRRARASTSAARPRWSRSADLELGSPEDWPLDPLTPVWRVGGDRDGARTRRPTRPRCCDARARCSPRRSASGWPTAHRARGRLRAGAPAVRPADRLVPGGEAPLRRHGGAHGARARRRATRRRACSTIPGPASSTARSAAPSSWRARPRC